MATPLFNNNDEPSATVVYVNPDIARRWLAKNSTNRKIRDSRVDQYARDMEAGRWKLTGEAIKFSRSGTLVDGQHRCNAVVESGSTVPMFVVRGVDEDVQGVLDSGAARTAADNLGMNGISNSHLVTAIARRRISLNNYSNLTNSEVYDYVAEHPEISFAAEIGKRYGKRCDIIPSTAGLAAWDIADVHGWEIADEFFCSAAEKIGLKAGDPVLAMTAFFGENRRSRRKLGLEAQLSVILRAFNARIKGRSLRLIKVASAKGGAIPVPMVEL